MTEPEYIEKKIKILGTRGIPAKHGGFETFAEHLALYLTSKGWEVTVYCQDDIGKKVFEERWKGVRLINIQVNQKGAFGTIVFDLKSILHATKEGGLTLTLGYNTAIFSLLYRFKGLSNLINMDGIEWQRDKWSTLERGWLYLNERLGCWLANHLIADNPEIKAHLATRVTEKKITTIPYGANLVKEANATLLDSYGLEPRKYCLVIARFEPENSLQEIVAAFSQKNRGVKLVILGQYDASKNNYQKKVLDMASKEVLFLGAIYDKPIVEALRYYCRLYIHGHQVGGTNPSLVESLGAGSAVLAHDNRFNRWVAGESAHYFKDDYGCESKLDQILDNDEELEKMKKYSLKRHSEKFLWEEVLTKYETILTDWHRNGLTPH